LARSDRIALASAAAPFVFIAALLVLDLLREILLLWKWLFTVLTNHSSGCREHASVAEWTVLGPAPLSSVVKPVPMPMGDPTHQMVLVYDAKRQLLEAFSEGRITRLYNLPYEGDHMFEIDEGERRSSWPRRGDSSWFVVGWHARIEHTPGERQELLRVRVGGPA
jgi:hypothetical protein